MESQNGNLMILMLVADFYVKSGADEVEFMVSNCVDSVQHCSLLWVSLMSRSVN